MVDPIKILYVDDYDLDRQLVRDVLNRERGPYQLSEARTAEEFKRCLAAADYDLVLSDFNILGYTGLQVLEAVQAKDPDLPVIIVTGTGSEEIAVKALKQGAADYVIKTAEHIRRLPGTIKHVLETKRLEQEKRATEDQLRFQATILENVRDAIQVTDLHGQTLYWNKGAEQIFGYTAAEMMGQSPALLYPRKESTQLEIDLQQILAGHDYQGEWQGRRKDGATVWIDVLTTVMRNTNGEAIGFIGISKDITARKQAEDALRQSEERYARAAEAGRVGIWEWDLETNEMYIDPHLKTMLGYADHEIKNHLDDWGKRVHPDDAARVMYEAQNHIEGRTARYQVEHRMLHKDGHVRWFLAQGMVVRDDAGRAVSMVGSDTDITERKEAELARRESQIQLELAIQAANAGLWDWDIEADTVYYSPEWKQQLGYADHELSNDFDAWQRLIHPDDRTRTLTALRAYLEKPWPDYQDEFRLRHKDGTYRWIMARGTLFIGQTGKQRRMLGLHLNITERKKIELKLQETNERLQAIVQASPLAIVALDRAGRVTVWSPAAEQLFGWRTEEVIGQPYPLAPGEKQAEFQQNLRSIWAGQVILGMEIRRQHKDGTLLDLRLDTAPLHDAAGNITGVMAIFADITEQKQAETTLRRSEERLELAIAGSKGGVWELTFDPSERHVMPDEMYISFQLKQFIGFEDDEFPNSMRAWQERILPEDLPHLRESAQRHLSGKTALYEVEYRIRHKDSSLRWIYSRGKIHRDETGDLRCWSGVDWDITAKKENEQALRASETKYRHLVETAHDLIWSIDAEGRITFINQAAERIYGRKPEEMIGRLYTDFIPPDQIAHNAETWAAAIDNQDRVINFENWVLHRDGTPVLLSANAILLRDEHGNITGSMGTSQDITQRKQAEKALQQYADRLQTLYQIDRAILAAQSVEETAMGALARLVELVPCRRADVSLFDSAQQTVERIAVYSQGEIISGQGFQIPVAETLLDLDTLRRGPPQQVVDYQALDGLSAQLQAIIAQLGVRASVTIPLIANSELVGLIGLGRAAPGRFAAEEIEIIREVADQLAIAIRQAQLYQQTQRHAEELEQRVAERTAELRQFYRQQAIAEERQRLARDLHDAVSQTLFSAGLLAEAIPRLWQRHPEQARRSLQDLRRLNRGALAEMRNLLLELRPAALEEARLAEMLRQLLDALAGRVQIETVLHVEDDIAVPAEVQLALYRITQESLNNIAKHARAGRVEVTLHSHGADQVTLTIRDDGRGFAPQQAPSGHLGLSIMRERAEKIGARLDITSRPGQGTKIVVTWPGD